MGRKMILFGGEATHAQPLNDLHMLDLDDLTPTWTELQLPEGSVKPPGRCVKRASGICSLPSCDWSRHRAYALFARAI
eukprot:1586689-Pyramimonas_sp.AAC.1